MLTLFSLQMIKTGSTRPPDERLVAPGEIDSGLLQNSTNRLLLQSWLPDGRDARALATLRNPAQGINTHEYRLYTFLLQALGASVWASVTFCD